MLGFSFIKTKPTDYVILYKNGKPRRQGAAMSFFFYAPTSSLVIIPAGSRDSSFIFNETTADFQTISIQGQFTFRVTDPIKLATLLDFSVDPDGRYTGDGMAKLPVRLTNAVQITLREKLKDLNLRQALTSAAMLVDFVSSRLKDNVSISDLGLEILDFTILQITPTPDMARALEASARETLLKEADEAVYERRNFAVDQERRIKENELQTEIAIEEKNRIIR
ncbi:MAG: SPFH domain-containing protein, partial [Leptonema sp. (in: Bacteria)]|nr:SPFH domain-containing protein [Leptonema sp. (in: bacteria)]